MRRVDEYQEIHKFDVVIDMQSEEIYVFANKKVSNVFMKRFRKSGYLEYERIFFDMSKIESIPVLSNIWGLWEDCNESRCKKKAYFGTEVHKQEGLNKDMVTLYNVKYEFSEENIVDLFIMYDCRLSSKSKLVGNSELFDTYQVLRNYLSISNNTECVTEAFEEDI